MDQQFLYSVCFISVSNSCAGHHVLLNLAPSSSFRAFFTTAISKDCLTSLTFQLEDLNQSSILLNWTWCPVRWWAGRFFLVAKSDVPLMFLFSNLNILALSPHAVKPYVALSFVKPQSQTGREREISSQTNLAFCWKAELWVFLWKIHMKGYYLHKISHEDLKRN